MEDTEQGATSPGYQFRPHSEAVDKISQALAKAQGVYEAVAKNKTADAGSYNYNYADLADIMAMLRTPFADNGLFVTHFTRDDGQGMLLETRLVHTSGQFIASELPVSGTTPQALGSSISYMRRYALGCLSGVVTEKDDDAQGAEADAKTRRPARKKAAAEPAKKPEAKPPDGDAAADVAEQKARNAWWGQIKGVMVNGGAITDAAEQEANLRDIMGTHGFESTKELNAAGRAMILKEVAEKFGPIEGQSPAVGDDIPF